MADLRISELPALAGALLQGSDPLALADLSASETKKVTVKDLIQHGVALIDPSSIPADKVNFTLPAGSVSTTELADHAVTAIKLADDSSGIVQAGLPAAGAFIGQLTVNTTDNKAYIWDGAAWHPFKAAASVNGLTYNNTLGPIGLAGIATGDSVELAAVPKDTTAGGLFMAGPAGAGGTVDYRAIVGTDLPAATATTRGAVQVSGDGLRMDGNRIEIDNDVTPPLAGQYQIVAYDAKGLVSDGKVIDAGDLPKATATTPGIVMPGSDLTVQPTGQLDHEQKVPGGGVFPKVTFNSTGHIIAGAPLDVADVPALPASKITSGTFPTDRLGDRSVTADKLADYALAFIQEAVPTAGVGSHPIGMTWLQESTGQVSVWNGNSWMKTGASTLFNRNLRYCGTFDATTATITGVTQFGTAEGYAIGDTIPAADDKQAGVYFVCAVAGSSSSLAGGVVFDAGDWVLNQGTAGGWVRIDTLSGGGGGSTVSSIGDLLDVTLTTPAKDQMLVYTSGGQWVNKPAPGGASTTPPSSPVTGQLWTDTSKSPPVLNVWDGTKWVVASGGVEAGTTAPTAPTAGQLWTDTSKTPPVVNVWDGTKWVEVGATPADASETVKGIIQLATTAEVGTGTDTVKAVTPKTLADNYLAKNIALLTALP